MEFQEEICKICLKKCEQCRTIDANITKVLSMLLPKTDFTEMEGAVICGNCAEILARCYDFKAMCLHTYKSILPFDKNSVKLDLKDVYLSKNATGTGVPEDEDICGFCSGLVKDVSAVSIVMMEKMVKQCLPEVDLSIIEKLQICAPCLESLENCFRLVTNCLIAEEKIGKYRDTLDVDCKDGIKLSNVLKFITTDVTSEVDGYSDDRIKERQFCGDEESPIERDVGHSRNIIKLEETFLEDCEHANEDVKIKNEIFTEMDDGKDDFEHPFTPKNMAVLEEESSRLGLVKTEGLLCEKTEAEHKGENLAEMEDQTSLLNEEVEIKTEDDNFNRFKDDTILSQTEATTLLLGKQTILTSDLEGREEEGEIILCVNETLTNHLQKYEKVKLYKCDICPYSTELKTSFKVHLLKHNAPLEVTMYQCDSCSYQTKCKRYFKSHSLKHKDLSEVTVVFKCEQCLFQTKRKSGLKSHMLTHKDPSEVTMYKCDLCSYQTKYKGKLKAHSLMHKDPSEVTLFKCEHCLFQTKHKESLNRHLLMHKDPSEVTMHKCASCSFQSKYRRGLRIHLLTYKDPSEVTVVFKCEQCLFQTKRKSGLKSHMLTHKDPSEVTVVFKCEQCLFQTKRKSGLKSHMLTHKDPSEVTMYQCDLCSYQAKFKEKLKGHLLTHKDPSEVTLFKCEHCLFQTKHKESLKKHLLTHKDPSEVKMYKCDNCSFQTVHKCILKNHLVKHKDSSEVTTYKCNSCLYQTVYKCYLKQHLLKHKDASEVTLYQCDHCSFQSKYKRCLKRHFMTHKNSCK